MLDRRKCFLGSTFIFIDTAAQARIFGERGSADVRVTRKIQGSLPAFGLGFSMEKISLVIPTSSRGRIQHLSPVVEGLASMSLGWASTMSIKFAGRHLAQAAIPRQICRVQLSAPS